jgi:acetyltransferase-like isoleucine patch superfamily enzyme
MRALYDLLAKHLPSNGLRIRCQRAKGVKIAGSVYLGYDTNIDTAFPELVEIQDHARIGIGVIILAHSRPADAWMSYMGERRAPVTIGRHASIYAGAIVMPGVTIGDYSIVREGSVVLDDVPAYSVAAGAPARVIEKLPCEKANALAGTPREPAGDRRATPRRP